MGLDDVPGLHFSLQGILLMGLLENLDVCDW